MKANIMMPHHTFGKYFSEILLTIVVLVSFLGMFVCRTALANAMSEDMTTTHHTTMSSCDIFVSKTCIMSIFEHLNNWTNTFVGIMNTSSMLLMFVLIGFYLGQKLTIFASRSIQRFLYYFRQYDRFHPDVGLYNFFTFFFAQGIIQPKIDA
ncbi:MAG: hypothetical protein A3B74_04625 [Candidatus Kerfeldbacteria bacterium RIFCSPHIGHO2_02_FULL_42_14]|uniref:Uncharacterized protein n=1 Tax=Candidatus Kerfeldbacteria bacterium RIFCSPHIGHO2_02_FULL_42_14 TaxID=1798540 RepID=A0A1G2ANZ0_9BACT|nr:MAG: hypothetical protein A3B74_04625 [Candidatus Kerfeldbacteria bacterium RIFCSPHIGHO2_02_FULL_42_14]OGY81011.1 MAG: hypothetical protein A3E60_03345 [Candidatus Kerfeldbacteria bacterium RIFCSPHIGHO2_12_FULL_42_13]OGY84955.1 MAG: hypothetical protein A3I91_00530 [Candidatus Kerfeldbacteria bacterium RIFCSPLOWO2_02_FULL_42_19]OGY86122.1 MAG: hypothetical protein A3G01_02060 [Candidatus Kerfeldbacteria bacterium RIFCSPLOWO2_12_FULL_43_9]